MGRIVAVSGDDLASIKELNLYALGLTNKKIDFGEKNERKIHVWF